ncbi:hypothetical protein ACN4EE_17800 [Geminocystis sp. CENA526]|uniref:hypothetical protein n=1 Tax=Geminocystis sp. CENA526 TaxID=1355871 RepID=UPI003D6ED20C
MTDSERLDKIETTLEKLVAEITQTKDEIIKTNDKVEIYQKASQQVVNLAFSLILTATITIVVQAVINK